MKYKKIIAGIMSIAVLSAGIYSYADNDAADVDYDLDTVYEEPADFAESDYGYIFTVKEPEVTLSSVESVDTISEDAGIYHADTLDDIYDSVPKWRIDKIARDIPVELFDIPDDPYYTIQWACDAVNYSAYWNNEVTGEGVRVAVIDTGLNVYHDDFGNLNYAEGANICAVLDGRHDESMYDITDQSGHGTGVASIIAAGMNDGVGIAGITDACTIIPIRIYDTDSPYSMMTSTLLNAIEYARQIDCDVINMSLGFTNPDAELLEITNTLIGKIYESGTIMVSASGNKGVSTNVLEYPAACEEVIGVGAVAQTGKDYEYADFSTANESVFISAPGKNIVTDNIPNGYVYRNGTSFACPMVAAAAVGAKYINPDIDTDMFKEILKETAVDISGEGYNIRTGWGMIDFAGVYDKVMETVYVEPEPAETPMPTDEPVATETPSVTDEPTATDEPLETEVPKETEEPKETTTPIPTAVPTITPKQAIETAVVDNIDSIQFIVYNNTGEKIEGTGIVAIYHKDGALRSIATVHDINYKRLVYNINAKANEIDVKFFMWDSLESMKPVDFSDFTADVQTFRYKPVNTVLYNIWDLNKE